MDCGEAERRLRNGAFRRILPVNARPGEGHLTEPVADVQPARRELVFMPQSGRLLPFAATPADAHELRRRPPPHPASVAVNI